MTLLSLIVLVVWLLVLARTVVNLLFLRRIAPAPAHAEPLVSVIIPARDEERTIERTVEAMLAQTWPALEIIVVDDRSKDATPAILERLAAGAAGRLRVVGGAEPPTGWLGKPWALAQGSAVAHGELFLFVDADVIYAPAAVAAAVAHLETRGLSMVALVPRIEMVGFWENVMMTNLGMVLFTAVTLPVANRSSIPFLAFGGGPGNLVRRSAYERAGGHEALRDAVVDDVRLARIVRRSGGRTEMARADHLVSIRMYHGAEEIIAGFTKNAFAALHRSYLASAVILVLGVVLHLLPYALALRGMPTAMVTVAVITATRLVLFRSLGYRLDNALLAHPLMVISWLWILLRSVWITGIRRRLTWRGRYYDAGRMG